MDPGAITVHNVWRRFAKKVALCDVSLQVRPGEIHALLGPNGAGKTTLLRILAGLTTPTQGSVSIMGHNPSSASRTVRGLVGLVPGGDRTFYLRVSGLENLVFFARLHGMSRRRADARVWDLLARVELLDAARLPVGQYSHGMQKRLAIARALLTSPHVLLMDEATHDLDPEAARRVRTLVSEAAAGGTAVLWTTQHLDELRGFAQTVTILNGGRVQFTGTVSQLVGLSPGTTYVLRIHNGVGPAEPQGEALDRALGGRGVLAPEEAGTPGHWILSLADGVLLGSAIAALDAARFQVLACREVRSEIEASYLRLTEGDRARLPEGGE